MLALIVWVVLFLIFAPVIFQCIDTVSNSSFPRLTKMFGVLLYTIFAPFALVVFFHDKKVWYKVGRFVRRFLKK
jgi:hypothetical protein